MSILLLGFALLLVVACGVFVAAEFSFLTVNRTVVERLSAKGDKRARGVTEALAGLSTQLSGAQVGITITTLAIGLLAEPAIASLLDRPLAAVGVPSTAAHGAAIVAGVTLATLTTMLFGELVPKNLAIARPVGMAKTVQGIQRAFSTVMYYPIRLLNGSANLLLGWLGIEPQEELASARSAEELASLVRRSADKGTLPKETAAMLERSLLFGDLTAADVMTPRRRMRTVTAADTAADVVELARRTGLSRFPVTSNNLGDIAGIVHIRQAVAIPPQDRNDIAASEIMYQPRIVPSSMELEPLLDIMRGGAHMAVVVDEFGSTDGIVTLEDLLEELVGDVRDEYDLSGPAIRINGSDSWTLSGLLRPDEIAQQLDVILPEDEDGTFDTLGGFITDSLGRLPVVGDAVKSPAMSRERDRQEVTLTVERMDGWRVDRVRLDLLPSVPGGAEEKR